MANELIEYLRGRKPKKFKSVPFYSKEGDFLTFFFKDADHYAERLDEIMTAYRSTETDQFVGFKLKGVLFLLETLGDLFVEILDDDGDLRLSMLLIAGTMKTKEHSALPVYQEFAQETKHIPIKKRELQLS